MMKCILPNRKLSYLPLRDAMLCMDCEFVSAYEDSVCPVCGSGSLLRVLDLLEGQAASRAHFGIQNVLEHLRLASGSATNRQR